jgi:hypothetical protein
MKFKPGNLKDTRVYLSGPMDFVASRINEQKYGWRNRLGEFLREFGVTVFDPWFKPEVRYLHDYGREGADTTDIREKWTFAEGSSCAEARCQISGKFWETMHIDLRMVDTSDFVIAYCPTNIYSVGTAHEIVMARLERKPVLLVSPPIVFDSLQKLKKYLKNDSQGMKLLDTFILDAAIKENQRGVPSLWYMPLIGGDKERFFDGFGFKLYIEDFGWEPIPLDEHEENYPPTRPLLPFLEKLNHKLPKKWDNRRKTFVRDDDWLIWDLDSKNHKGAVLSEKVRR